MENHDHFRSTVESCKRSHSQFLARLRRSRAHQRIAAESRYQQARLEHFEEFCWRCYYGEIHLELKGARAAYALSMLESFERALGDPSWLPLHVAQALDELRQGLTTLAAKKRRGRPRDTVGRLLGRSIHIFLPRRLRFDEQNAPLRVETIDEITNELLAVILGRTGAVESYVRMRRRQRTQESHLAPMRQSSGTDQNAALE